MKTDFSTVNRGIYPQKPMWRSTTEKWLFGGMVLYSIAIYFYIACIYVYGGQ